MRRAERHALLETAGFFVLFFREDESGASRHDG